MEILETCRTFWQDFGEFEVWMGGEHDALLGTPTVIVRHGEQRPLEPPLIDLRLVKKRVARSRGLRFASDSEGFNGAFSRAVRGLIRRGLLGRADYAGYREIRFVCLPE